MSLFREIAASCIWLYLFIKLMIFDIDVYFIETYYPSLNWILMYKFVVLLVVIATSWLIFGKRFWKSLVLYILLYPFRLFFWKLPILIFKHWPATVIFLLAGYDVAKSLKFQFISCAFALLAALCVLVSGNLAAIVVSMSYLSIFLVTTLLFKIRKAYTANLFEGLSLQVKQIRDKIETGSFFTIKPTDFMINENEKSKPQRSGLSVVYISNWICEFIAEELHKVVKTRRLDLYLVLDLGCTFLVTLVIFALQYYGLDKASSNAFNQTGLTFWAFLGLSFSIMTPSDLSTVAPASDIAKFLTYCEGFCSLLIFLILVFTLFTSARERFFEDIRTFVDELRLTSNAIESQVKARCERTLSDLECILIRSDRKLINHLRKLRGLSEINESDSER